MGKFDETSSYSIENEAAAETTQMIESLPLTKVLERPAPDPVSHPPHYGGAANPYEAIKVIEAWELGFSLGNALKYICRAGRKRRSTQIEDLKKARWYLDAEIAKLEGNK
jgi:hypothetical protein